MANWKKIIVSGSNAHLSQITSSVLTDDNLVIAGPGGALENSGLTLSGGVLNAQSNSIVATGASTSLTGSFSGSFKGDGSQLTGLVTTLDISGSDGSGISIDIKTQDLTISGTANEIETSTDGTTVTIGLPDDVTITNNLTAKSLRGYNSLLGTSSSATTTFVVTVSAKTSNHRYFGTGSASGYYIDGIESPFITLLPGKTYRFDQSAASNGSHPILFYYDAARTLQYTTNVTTNGSAGSAGAFTQIVVTDTTPIVLHYQCANHGYMGNAAQFNSNVVDTPYLVNAKNGINVTGNAVISGDLTVNGTTTTINTTNLLVEDKFILLNSGSANPDEGGLVIDEGGGTGHALIYESDSGIQRWGFNESVSSTVTTANTTAYAAAVLDLTNANHADVAEYQKTGNVKVDTSGDIYIWA